jgi:hypothetical protein
MEGMKKRFIFLKLYAVCARLKRGRPQGGDLSAGKDRFLQTSLSNAGGDHCPAPDRKSFFVEGIGLSPAPDVPGLWGNGSQKVLPKINL